MNNKFKLRKSLLANRENFNAYDHVYKDMVIYEKVKNLLEVLYPSFKKITTNVDSYELHREDAKCSLGIYYPLKGEPDLFKLAVSSDWCICLPKLESTEMKYVKYKTAGNLVKSEFGDLYEPSGNDVIIPKVALVPALTFDLKGYRLGFGIGHYDRYFAEKKHNEIIKIGICYDDKLLERIPYDVHDIKMDYIITETNTYFL